MKTEAERALEHALNWWEAVEMITRGAADRGVTFHEDYLPTWVTEARAALRKKAE